MTLWEAISAEEAPEAARPALDAMRSKFGMVPNVGRALAENPGTLCAYLAMREALGNDPLRPLDVEAVSLAVSNVNGCRYCIAAHSGAASSLGADADEVARNLEGRSGDPRRAALARLARRMTETAGAMPDEEIAELREALTTRDMIAVAGWVAVNTLANIVNRFVGTEMDLGGR